MRLGGQADRIELKPETDEEKAAVQRIIDGDVVIFWGDSEFEGGALILNNAKAESVGGDCAALGAATS